MSGLANLSIVILAGGQGTRLRPAIADRPKVLADIHRRPFITILLDQLIQHGARKVILATGYKSDQVSNTLGHAYRSLKLSYSVEAEPRGTGGALRHALPLIDADTTLVMNGDSFINANMDRYASWFHENRHAAALLLARVEEVRRYGVVEFTGEKVSRFAEKGLARGAGFINAGVYLLRRSVVETIPRTIPFSLEHDFFPSRITAGLSCYCTNGAFIDIGTPAAYGRGEDFFSNLPAAAVRHEES